MGNAKADLIDMSAEKNAAVRIGIDYRNGVANCIRKLLIGEILGVVERDALVRLLAAADGNGAETTTIRAAK